MTYYESGIKLLETLSELESDLKYNYEHGDISQQALANIAGLQCDLFGSYIILLGADEKGPIVGRSVVLRSILENQGIIHHIKGDSTRAKAYLDHVEKIQLQTKNHVNGIETLHKDFVWSTSTIQHRVSLVGDSASRLYDTLSNFSHGNNVQHFLDTKVLTDSYIKAIDSYFVGLLIDFLAEIAIDLNMDHLKRKRVFDATHEVGSGILTQ